MAHSSCDHEGGIGRAALALALAIMGLASPAVSQAPSAARSGTVHALLINGGSQPASNYLSHLEHLQEMVALLQRRGVAPEHIHVFSADGDDPAADLTMRTGPPQDFWLIADTAVGKRLAPRVQLVDTSWSAVKLHPARLDDLRRWFEAARTEIPPGDQLLLFVTDHGGTARAGPGSGTISLWHEQLTVRELRSLLDRLSSRVRVVTVMSQCYSGAFADLMYDRGVDPPSGNTCGFFATSAEDKAYGCYPEGQDLKRTGYAFQFIDALGQQSAVVDAHLQVVQADAAPDKPRRTSDAYLSRLVSDEAAARGADPDELTDFLLASAWRLPARWEPEIRLLDAIGESFGTFSPRSLRELKSRERGLAEHAEQLKTYSNRWSAALTDVKESLLVGFLAAHPDWRAELEPQVVEALPADQRTSMLDRLLRELHPFAQQSTAWGKLERFREAASQAADASWRFEVRRAAAERMRTILTSVAGRELLSGTSSTAPRPTSRASQQDALSALARCEAMEPGTLSQPVTRQAARVSFPPMTDEVDLLRTLQPSWLGVRYGPVPQALRTAQPSLSGAPQVQFVEDNSPAADAGLEPGDVIIGPHGRPFSGPGDLREWTLTSPRNTPLLLRVFRQDAATGDARQLDVVISLRPYPPGRPESGVPPRLGAPAPTLPRTLRAVRNASLPDVKGRAHLLFFWATWCGPCKAALPEVMAFAAAKQLPVLAITDEDEATVSNFLNGWLKPFFESVGVDSIRNAFISYGISGTPTIVLVDAEGLVRYRQVGYSPAEGLKIEGWRWSGR